MSNVLIGHASISENGTINGKHGDQTKKEVFTRQWYSMPANVLLICTDKALAKKAAQEMRIVCANDNIGYGQSDRTTAFTSGKANGNSFEKAKGNTDCSQLIAACYIFAGLTGLSPNCYTGNLRAALLATGKFKAYTQAAYLNSNAYAEVGAVYLREGRHTFMALENGLKSGQSTGGSAIVTSNDSGTAYLCSVKNFQNWLNTMYPDILRANCGALLVEDGKFGIKTKQAALCAWKHEMNKMKVGHTFDLKNKTFGSTCRQYGNRAVVRRGSKGNFVFLLQGMLRAAGHYKGLLDGDAGSLTDTAIRSYQKASNLTVDGSCGANTWFKLFN